MIGETVIRRGGAELLALEEHRSLGAQKQEAVIARTLAGDARLFIRNHLPESTLIVIFQKVDEVRWSKIESELAARSVLPVIALTLNKVAAFGTKARLRISKTVREITPSSACIAIKLPASRKRRAVLIELGANGKAPRVWEKWDMDGSGCNLVSQAAPKELTFDQPLCSIIVSHSMWRDEFVVLPAGLRFRSHQLRSVEY